MKICLFRTVREADNVFLFMYVSIYIYIHADIARLMERLPCMLIGVPAYRRHLHLQHALGGWQRTTCLYLFAGGSWDLREQPYPGRFSFESTLSRMNYGQRERIETNFDPSLSDLVFLFTISFVFSYFRRESEDIRVSFLLISKFSASDYLNDNFLRWLRRYS